MKKLILALSLTGLVALLLTSTGCYYDKAELLKTGSNSCDTTTATYSLKVKPIIDSYCNPCHSTNSNSAGLLLDSYTTLKAQVTSGRLMLDIKQDPATSFNAMPKGGAKISDCEISIIQAWINVGTPN
jgi:cytochrome c5